MKNYRVETEPVSLSGVIDAKDSNEIIFINKGTATAEIDGFPLAFNEFLTDAGNADEINKSRYRITFTSAGTFNLFVRRKYYINN
jgi:hypothetical protein